METNDSNINTDSNQMGPSFDGSVPKEKPNLSALLENSTDAQFPDLYESGHNN